MLIVHASDLHIDSPLLGLSRYPGCPAEAIRGATRRALSRLVDFCLREEAALLLIAGDLYDGAWKDYATGLFFVREMGRLREAGVRVVLVRGNHDAESEVTRGLRLPENVRDLSTSEPETVRLEDIGVSVTGQGFWRRDVTDDLAKRYPKPSGSAFHIGILHTALSGREGHQSYAPCSVETLIDRGYDYWALGHVHEREIVSERPFIVFPGNLQGRHARETGAKGATSFRVEGGRVRDLTHHALDVVRFGHVVLEAEAEDSQDDLLDSLDAELRAARQEAGDRLLAIRVTVQGSAKIHASLATDPAKFEAGVRAVAASIDGDQTWIAEVRDRTKPLLDLERLLQAGSIERGDPLWHLLSSIERISGSPDELADLASLIAPLAEKLPEDLRDASAARVARDPAALKELLPLVRDLLVGRILGERTP